MSATLYKPGGASETKPRMASPSTGGPARTPGEPWVWISAMGLSVGLLMVVGLLGVIVWHGAAVFWPQRVVELQLAEGSKARVKDSAVVAGEIRMEQTRREAVAGGGSADVQEVQLFTGNRDAYGFSFHFVDERDIAGRSEPADIAVYERLEYGDAIGYPVEIRGPGESKVAASDPGFDKALVELKRSFGDMREEIKVIEKKRIGALNERMERLRIGLKSADAPRVVAIQSELAELQKQYEVLAAEARKLRSELVSVLLAYRLPTGETRTLQLGALVDSYYPNRLGFLQRCGRTAHNVWNFLSEEPREANTEGGVFPAIFGTFFMTILMSAAVTPFGVLAAIYLREYARQGAFVRAVRIAVNNLAGVPSIVFGVFGLGFFVYFLGGNIDRLFFASRLPTPTFGTGGVLWAAMTLALMTVPVVIVATEEAIAAVPRGVREGSLACGASKWQTIQRIVLPASVPGIITGLILAMARGAGEVAPLMLVGVVKLAPTLPLDGAFPFVHLDRKFMHLGFHIYDLGFQSPDSEAAKPMVFATTLLLIVLVVVLNLGAILLREHLRKKYKTGAF